MNNQIEHDIAFWTGFYKDDCDDNYDYFIWASNKAYLDMNRTMTFRKDGGSEAEKKAIDEKRAEWKNEGTKVIRDGFEKLKKCEDFDGWHEEVCGRIINVYKYAEDKSNESKLVQREGKNRTDKPDNLTFGQAQKWLNMTLKYL